LPGDFELGGERVRRTILVVVAIVAIGFVAIQLVPYGRDHTNPPVTGEPAWDSPQTRELAKAACFDCHSNETVWPWYSNVAPISWRLQNHVDEGRSRLNFSEWGTREQETEHMVSLVQEGEMPPWDFKLTHPEARLSDADTQALIDGLGKTFGAGSGGGAEN
jgi:mono/diheme cytochrome c family protein